MKLHRKTLLIFSLSQIVAYFLLVGLISLVQSTSFDSVPLDTSGNLLLKTLKILALMTGFSMIYLTPGLLWIAKENDDGVAQIVIKSALLSIVLYTLTFSALKLIFAIELSRSWMLLTSLGITVTWALADRRQFEIALEREAVCSLLIGGLTVLSLIVFLHGKIFIENFSGDGTENFEFSRSLKTRILPYWDLENGYWGFHPRFMFFAYPNVLSILHLGEIEASVRLPFFIFLFCIYLMMVALAKGEPAHSKGTASDSLLASVAITLFVTFNVFYSTWEPYFADIAEPSYVDTMVTFYVLSAILFLLNEKEKWFLLCCFLASLSLANGVVLTFWLFSTFLLLGRNRKRILILGLSFMTLYLAYLGFVAVYDRFHPMGFQRWSITGMLRYFAWSDLLEANRYFFHVKYLLLMTGVMPVLVFPFTAKRDGLALRIYVISSLYALGVFSFRSYNPHYFASAALLFFVAFSRVVASLEGRKARYLRLAYAMVVSVIILSIFPQGYIVNENARSLGSQTCIEAFDYPTQVALAERIYKLFPFKKYGIGHHTLVYYAAKGDCSGEKPNYLLTVKRDKDLYGFTRTGELGLWMRKGVKKPDYPRKRYDGNYRYILREIYDRNRAGT